MLKKIIFELCSAEIRTVELAEQYQVPSIEICQCLHLGGLTPSIAFIKESRKLFSGELNVLIRPRGGNYTYSKIEKRIMFQDILHALDAGVDGIVVGAINKQNQIDQEFLEELISDSKGIPICFHKAFDEITDPITALKNLMLYKIDRVLTSGLGKTAEQGVGLIRELVTVSSDGLNNGGQRIEIMAGGSIRKDNIEYILKSTTVSRIHSSLWPFKIEREEKDSTRALRYFEDELNYVMNTLMKKLNH